jgi:hypothetical protein
MYRYLLLFVALAATTSHAATLALTHPYRVWKPFGDSNHRFTTDRAVVDEMIAQGCIDEGPAMCGVR